MIQLDAEERRRRLAVRHRLAPAHLAGDPAEVTRSLVALHSTDPATVYLSVRARHAGPSAADALDDALYERRELVRMLGMRRTVFVFPAESVPVVQRSTTDRIAGDQRKLLLKLLSEAGEITAPVPWLAEAETAVLGALDAAGGSLTAAELTAAVPALRTQLVLAAGKPYEARTNVTSRLLFLLAAEGKLIRGRPLGSWLSQQYRWWLAQRWLPEPPGSAVAGAGLAGAGLAGAGLGGPGLAGAGLGGPGLGGAGLAGGGLGGPGLGGAGLAGGGLAGAGLMTEASARTALARQWLAAFGPAPLADLKWWTGWTMGQVRQAVAELNVAEVDLGPQAGTGVVLPGDLEPASDPGPWTALLPALDPTPMGWADRTWFLGPHAAALFDKTGNVGPTIWLNGRVVGGWAQRPDGEVAIRLLEEIGPDGTRLVDAEAVRLREWLGDQRVTPRFRTPVERELSA